MGHFIPLGVHSLLKRGTMCVHDHKIITPNIQDFPSYKWYMYDCVSKKSLSTGELDSHDPSGYLG